MTTSCNDREPLINAYVDGELDLSSALELEHHIAECSECSGSLSAIRNLKNAISAPKLSYSLPRGLEKRIWRTAQASARRTVALPLLDRALLWGAGSLAAAAVVMLFAVLLFHAGRLAIPQTTTAIIGDQVVSSHIRSLMPNHLYDVVSTDQHTVKPWFAGKIDYTLPVSDFKEQGFRLIGGRLDYIDNRPVAATVYRHALHVINLFCWPVSRDEPASAPIRAMSRRGYNIVYWNGSGMTFWAVSDLNANDLSVFARLVQNSAQPSEAPAAR